MRIKLMSTEEIRQLRLESDMTQEDFAHEIGVTFSTVNRWENGKSSPNQLAVRRLRQMQKKLRDISKHR